jgi:hypothetical protein
MLERRDKGPAVLSYSVQRKKRVFQAFCYHIVPINDGAPFPALKAKIKP